MSRQFVRDTGKWVSERIPLGKSLLRWIYGILPSGFHDHPENFLERYFARSEHVEFIQIGAHDGISGDPIRPNVLRNAFWSGVLVEPNPMLFEQLKNNYAGHPRLSFKCAAISDSPGVLPLYVVTRPGYEGEFPHWWSEVSSLDKDHLLRELPEECHALIDQIEVPVLTLRDIMSDGPGKNVNLIVMDVEGHEPPILRYLLNSNIRPDVLVFEHKHMPQSVRMEFATEFYRQGYRTKSYGRDTVIYRPIAGR